VQARLETKRRCSFCAKTDHNRRTCQEFKDSKVTFVERTKLYRELMVEALIEKGIGIGTLRCIWLIVSIGMLPRSDLPRRRPI
jgi:hypothetical protein